MSKHTIENSLSSQFLSITNDDINNDIADEKYNNLLGNNQIGEFLDNNINNSITENEYYYNSIHQIDERSTYSNHYTFKKFNKNKNFIINDKSFYNNFNINNEINIENVITGIPYINLDIECEQNINNEENVQHKYFCSNIKEGSGNDKSDDERSINSINNAVSFDNNIHDDNNIHEHIFHRNSIDSEKIRQPENYTEQITPTYINMLFNATCMIPLQNVSKMIKNEPIETIDDTYNTYDMYDMYESYDTYHTADMNNTNNNANQCIPVVDFCSWTLKIS